MKSKKHNFSYPKNITALSLIGIYIGMFVLTFPYHEGYSLNLYTATVFSLVCCVISLYLIPNDIRIGILFVIFVVSYYVTITLRPFLWILQETEGLPTKFSGSLDEIISASVIGNLAVLALLSGLIFINVLPPYFRNLSEKSPTYFCKNEKVDWLRLSKYLFYILLVLLPLFNLLTMKFGIGFGGREWTELPFHLTGIILTCRAFLIYVVYFLIQCAFYSGSKRYLKLSILYFAINTVWITLIIGSRGHIMGSLIFVMLLYIFLADKINYKMLLVSLALMLFIFAPLFMVITAFRSVDGVMDYNMIREVMEQDPEFYKGGYKRIFIHALMRFTGIETLIPLLQQSDYMVGLIKTVILQFNDVPLSFYYSWEILNVPEWTPMSFTMGQLGEFLMIGGVWLVFFGALMFLIASYIVWMLIIRSNITTKPFILSYFCLIMMNLITEGRIIDFFFNRASFLPIIGLFLSLEFFARRFKVAGTCPELKYYT